MFEPGPVTLVIEVKGFSGSFSFMFVELANHSIAKGSPRTRLQIMPMELHPGHEGAQRCELTFTAHTHIAYKISGHIHGDSPLGADSLSVTSDRPSEPLRTTGRQRHRTDLPQQMVQADLQETGRLFDLTTPGFEQPYSQAMSAAQFRHPAFARLQMEIFDGSAVSDSQQWPEIFALRVLETFGKADGSRASIGFDAINGALWQTLLKRGHDMLVVERTYDPSVAVDLGELRRSSLVSGKVGANDEGRFHHSLIGEALPPEYCGQFDFAWWITRSVADRKMVLRGLLNVAESLGGNGVGVAIFPIHHEDSDAAGAISFKTDLPRILIDAMSLGHKIVQVRMTAPVGQETTSLTYFAIIVYRPANVGADDPVSGAAS